LIALNKYFFIGTFENTNLFKKKNRIEKLILSYKKNSKLIFSNGKKIAQKEKKN